MTFEELVRFLTLAHDAGLKDIHVHTVIFTKEPGYCYYAQVASPEEGVAYTIGSLRDIEHAIASHAIRMHGTEANTKKTLEGNADVGRGGENTAPEQEDARKVLRYSPPLHFEETKERPYYIGGECCYCGWTPSCKGLMDCTVVRIMSRPENHAPDCPWRLFAEAYDREHGTNPNE